MRTGYYLTGNSNFLDVENEEYAELPELFEGASSPYEYADVFLHGSCQLFALELHNRYGYEGLNLQVPGNENRHFFCTTNVGGKDVYIDVRGITDNLDDLIDEFVFDDYEIVEYDFSDEKNLSEADKVGLDFARQIIDNNRELYEITAEV